MRPKKLAGVLLAAVSTLALPAFAGEKTPVSAVPMLPAVKDAETPPKVYGVTGITMKEQASKGSSSYYDIAAVTSRGYCLVTHDAMLRLESSTFDTDSNELWRFVAPGTDEGKATLERTRYQVAPYLKNAWVKSKTSVELKALATEYGVTAWAMRETNGDVVILAQGASGGRESIQAPEKDAPSIFNFASSSCPFGAVRLSAYAIAHGGGSAQLVGHLPAIGEGKAKVEPGFLVDVSVMKLARDPEPVVSARIRKIVP